MASWRNTEVWSLTETHLHVSMSLFRRQLETGGSKGQLSQLIIRWGGGEGEGWGVRVCLGASSWENEDLGAS